MILVSAPMILQNSKSTVITFIEIPESCPEKDKTITVMAFRNFFISEIIYQLNLSTLWESNLYDS